MAETTLVIGGCRSGKSRHALALAKRSNAERRLFLATCVPRDAEMRDRVARHRAERSGRWETLEIPLALSEAIGRESAPDTVILVDCLTLWTTNLVLEDRDVDDIAARAAQLATALTTARGPVVLVSNEVGAGIVPENPMARLFRDAAGLVNQTVAQASDRVVWMVAGIPVPIRGATG